MEQVIYIFIISYLLVSPVPFHVVRTFRMRWVAKKYNLNFESNYSFFSILISDVSFRRKKVNIISGEISGIKVQVDDTVIRKFFPQKTTEFFLNDKEIKYDRGINFFLFVHTVDKWLESVQTGNLLNLGSQAKEKKIYYYTSSLIFILVVTIFYFSIIRLF